MDFSNIKVRLTGISLCLALSALTAAKTIYVDDDASAAGNGSSWQTAYKYLQDALADAKTAEKPVEIRVAQGIYRPGQSWARPEGTKDRTATFCLLDKVTTRGGFAGVGTPDPNARDAARCQSVLSGDLQGDDADVRDLEDLLDATVANSRTVVTGSGTDGTAVLDGFTITGGHWEVMSDPPTAGAAGMYNRAGSPTVIRCTFARNAAVGCAGMYNDSESNPVLIDCVFTTNYAVGGSAGVTNVSSSPRLIGCTFSNNRARDGAALYNRRSHPVLERCTFLGNSAVPGLFYLHDRRGGAIFSEDSTCTLADCTFEGNEASYGGAIYSGAGCTLIVAHCAFIANRSQGPGGAICAWAGEGTTVLTDCIFRRNSSGEGGAISFRGSLAATRCLFSGNSSESFGGAAVLEQGTFTGCVFAGNRASRYLLMPDNIMIPAEGGAVYARGAGTNLVVLTDCTLYGNRADRACGIRQEFGSLVVRGCILRGSNGQIQPPSSDCPIQVEYCNVQGGWAGEGNIDVDPCFADTGYWDPNGTPEDPNDDFFVEGDYHLRSQAGRWDPAAGSWVVDDVTSPCIDAGDPNSPVGEEPFPNGGRVNMGAYGGTAEASMAYFDGPVCETIIAGDINGDCRADWADLRILALHWLEKGNPEGIIEPDIGK
jgi:predicted outer membrane repeat protein